MNKDNIIFIGLDTHKTFTQIALLKEHRGAKPESLGKINTKKSGDRIKTDKRDAAKQAAMRSQ